MKAERGLWGFGVGVGWGGEICLGAVCFQILYSNFRANMIELKLRAQPLIFLGENWKMLSPIHIFFLVNE